MSRYQRDGDAPFFTPEMDEVLRNAVNSSSTRKIRWEAIARLLPGASSKACRARWEDIQDFSGLENMSFAARQPLKRTPHMNGIHGTSCSTHTSSIPPRSRWHSSRQKLESRGSGSPAPRSKPSSGLRSPREQSKTQQGDGEGGTGELADIDEMKDDVIVIHVCDEARGVNRDFHCRRRILIKGMKYFRSYLSESASFEEIDISVHCDVHIFQYLMNYIKSPNKTPSLDLRNVISILISSDFLQMEQLVTTCLTFIKDNMSQILKSPIDLSCLSSKLVILLSDMFSPEELDAIEDPKDKITQRLFMRKTEKLLHDPRNTLYMCENCGKLFTAEQQRQMSCVSSRNLFIDFHGNAVTRHAPSKSWSLRKYLLSLRGPVHKLSWKEVFWIIFANLHTLRCRHCRETYTLASYDSCCSDNPNPSEQNGGGEAKSKYACCGAAAAAAAAPAPPLFSITGAKTRCERRCHSPITETKEESRLASLVDSNIKEILSSVQIDGHDAVHVSVPVHVESAEKIKNNDVKKDMSSSHFAKFSVPQRLLPMCLPSAPDKWGPASYGGLEAAGGHGTGAESDLEDSDDDRQIQSARRRIGASSNKVRGHRVPASRRRRRKKSLPAAETNRTASSADGTGRKNKGESHQKQWKMDRMIDEDRLRMGSLMSTLASLRTSVNAPTRSGKQSRAPGRQAPGIITNTPQLVYSRRRLRSSGGLRTSSAGKGERNTRSGGWR